MENNKISEIKYLKEKLAEISYPADKFNVYISEDRILVGVISTSDDSPSPFSKIMKYKTLYCTLLSLDWKIKISLSEAINYSYKNDIQKNFSAFGESSDNEKLAFYYIENAIFRLSTVWDILAQIYCIFYKLDIPITNVNYKRIFNPSSAFTLNYKEKATEINAYLNEKDDITDNLKWKGNHMDINTYRNKMAHRNAPDISSLSDFDSGLKPHPSFLLKRVIEDYVVANNFILEILNRIDLSDK